MATMAENPGQYWRDNGGPRWVKVQAYIDRVLAPFGDMLLSAASPQPGEHVVEIGCGSGTTTQLIAKRVGETGSVLGIDISPDLVDHAKARGTGIAQLSFVCEDAAAYPFNAAQTDLVTSRFGVMFFPNPIDVFGHIHTCLTPTGRLVMMCWQNLAQNPWITYILGAFPELEIPYTTGTEPGPFSLASPDHTRDILTRAGYRNIVLESATADVSLGTTAAEALAGQMLIGPLSGMLSQAEEEEKPKLIERARRFLEDVFAEGAPKIPAAAWLICADANEN